MRKAKFLKNMVSFYIGKVPFLAKVRPSEEGTSFPREYKHSASGVEGECAACANANAGMEAGIAPLCVSLDSRFIGLDRFIRTKQGGYFIGRIWRSEQGAFQKKFDNDKAALLKSPDAVGTVNLYPYPVRQKPSKNKTSGPKGNRLGGKKGFVRVLRDQGQRRGALKRADRSGIGLPLFSKR